MRCAKCGADAAENQTLCPACAAADIASCVADASKPDCDSSEAPLAGLSAERIAQLKWGGSIALSGIVLGVIVYFTFRSLGFASIGLFPFAAGAVKIISALFTPAAESALRG